MDEEITIDTVNDLYVTQVPGKMYYKLYRDKELIHTHTKHEYNSDIEEPVTVYTMVDLYTKELHNKVTREINAVMSSLDQASSDDPHSDWVDGKKPPLRAPSDNDDLVARPDQDYRTRSRARASFDPGTRMDGLSYYWAENADPSNPI